jgi:hypothetical protein
MPYNDWGYITQRSEYNSPHLIRPSPKGHRSYQTRFQMYLDSKLQLASLLMGELQLASLLMGELQLTSLLMGELPSYKATSFLFFFF